MTDLAYAPGLGRAPATHADTATCVLRPSDEQARHASRFVPAWLKRVRDCAASQVIIDLSEVCGLDFSGFGVLLAKLRDVLRVTASITGIGVSDLVSLQSMGLLDGIDVARRRPPR